jgi:hypothetical protein
VHCSGDPNPPICGQRGGIKNTSKNPQTLSQYRVKKGKIRQ